MDYRVKAATARPIGQAKHCLTVLWPLILISYIGILLIRLPPAVTQNNCRSTIEYRLTVPSMLLGKNVRRIVEREYKIERAYTARVRFHERFLLCFFEPCFVITIGQVKSSRRTWP